MNLTTKLFINFITFNLVLHLTVARTQFSCDNGDYAWEVCGDMPEGGDYNSDTVYDTVTNG